jgi:hypothetical protein
MMNPTQEQRPLGELFSELASETGTLVRKEVELAKTEMTDKAKTAGRNAVGVVVGGVVAFMGALALIAALILALGTLIPLWVSALLVGAVVTAIGSVLVMKGLSAFKHLDPVPRETVRTLKEDRRWARQQLSR